jgi:hypothetical protein
MQRPQLLVVLTRVAAAIITFLDITQVGFKSKRISRQRPRDTQFLSQVSTTSEAISLPTVRPAYGPVIQPVA